MTPKIPFLFFFIGVAMIGITLIFTIFKPSSEFFIRGMTLAIFMVVCGIFIRVTWDD